MPFSTDSVRMPVLSPASSPWYSISRRVGQAVVQADEEAAQLLGQGHERSHDVGDVAWRRR